MQAAYDDEGLEEFLEEDPEVLSIPLKELVSQASHSSQGASLLNVDA